MKKIKNIFIALIVSVIFSCSFVLSACGNNNNTNTNDAMLESTEETTKTTQSATNVKNAISSITTDETEVFNNAQYTIIYADGVLSVNGEDMDTDSESETYGQVIINENVIATKTTSKKGNVTITILKGGNWEFRANSGYTGNIDINADGDINLLFDTQIITGQTSINSEYIYTAHLFYSGETTLSYSGKKVIDNGSSNAIILTILDGANVSVNNNSGAHTSDNKNAISSDSGIVINGTGVLNINSEKTAIKADGIVKILGTTINILNAGYYTSESDQEGHGIKGESINLLNANIIISGAGKDGLHAELTDEDSTAFTYNNGFVYAEGTTLTIAGVNGDGVYGDSFVYIVSGTYNITTTTHMITATSSSSSYFTRSSSASTTFSGISSNYSKKASDEIRSNYSSYYSLATSTKGIKVGEIDYDVTTNDVTTAVKANVSEHNYLIYIVGGTFTINTFDDAI
ncbi:MAG: carbohydrate-binding domain-containing protein, partial [Clostridia bacterium]|nr:carbohydrate-binding domain-containing protein [Clostridia bacterium]